MKRTERDVYFYNLKVDTRAKHAPIPKLSEIAQVWMENYEVEDFNILRDQGTIKYRIGDIRLIAGENILEVLIRRSDVNAPDAAFSNFQTGKLRIAKKREKEAGDTGAHLLISLKEEKNQPNIYLCMLEGVHYISHQVIRSLLNSITRLACKNELASFEYAHPSGAKYSNGEPKMRSHQPRVELNGHMSESFKEDIERGFIRGLELIERRGKIQLGGDPYLIEDRYSLKIRVEKGYPEGKRSENLLKAMRSLKNKFSIGRISFKDKNNKSHTVAYDLKSGSPEQQTYIKSFTIKDINPPMALSSETIVDHFANKIRTKLKKERNIKGD